MSTPYGDGDAPAARGQNRDIVEPGHGSDAPAPGPGRAARAAAPGDGTPAGAPASGPGWPVRRGLRLLAWAGLLALQLLVARTYRVRGTWWHWLLHVPIGIGIGLAVAAVLTLWRRQPALPWALAGQLVSMGPDLMFRFLRMPHEPAMDAYLGHISVHRGPSPVLTALGVLLLGGWAYVSGRRQWRLACVALALAGGGLLLAACLLAAPLPTRLSQF